MPLPTIFSVDILPLSYPNGIAFEAIDFQNDHLGELTYLCPMIRAIA